MTPGMHIMNLGLQYEYITTSWWSSVNEATY